MSSITRTRQGFVLTTPPPRHPSLSSSRCACGHCDWSQPLVHSPPSHSSKTVLSTVHDGGAEGIRTPDPLHAKQVLSQLSYSPVCPDEGRASRACNRSISNYSLATDFHPHTAPRVWSHLGPSGAESPPRRTYATPGEGLECYNL